MSAINIRNINNESRSEASNKVSQNDSNVVNKSTEARQVINNKTSKNFSR